MVDEHAQILATGGIYRNQGDIPGITGEEVLLRSSSQADIGWTLYDPGEHERIWSVASNGIVPHEDTFPENIEVHISLTPGFTATPGTLYSSLELNDTQETITGLLPTVAYYLQIFPVDAYDNASTNIAHLTLDPATLQSVLERGPKLFPSKFTAVVGERITLDASSSQDPSGLGIYNYTYDFGDGSDTVVTTLTEIAHIYNVTGTYTLDLTLLNANSIEVDILIPPDIIIRENIYVRISDSITTVGVNEFFTADSTDSFTIVRGIKNTTWDFGDAANSTTANPNVVEGRIALHRYAETGTYVVTCSIQDELAERTISDTLTITVE